MQNQNTLFSFVNRWECDENDHLNVQFYFSRFEEADRQFQQVCGLSESIVGARRVRHVRFHREMRTGTLITVRSYAVLDGPHILCIVHEMLDGGTGELCATALDGYAPPMSAAKDIRKRFKDFLEPMREEASPLGLAASPATGKASLDAIMSSGAQVCYRGTVRPADLAPDGRVDDSFVIGAISNAVPHVWQTTPFHYAYLTEHNLGRVALEMKLTWHSPLKSGDMFLIASGLASLQTKTLSLRHYLFEFRTRRLVAICDMVAAMMDLETRKTVMFPQDLVKSLHMIPMK